MGISSSSPDAPPSRQEVVIKRRNGDQFSIVPRRPAVSPFDVPPIRTRATTQDILDAIRESRERG